ncbi:MAG: Tfp pilus assembly protein PilF, partial [Planctomycetota bacterium]
VETLAGCLLEEDHFAQVLELLEPLAGQVADRHQCQVYLAATYEHLGQPERALQHYRAALLLRPTDGTVARAISKLE